jgi:hypothetical protein
VLERKICSFPWGNRGKNGADSRTRIIASELNIYKLRYVNFYGDPSSKYQPESFKRNELMLKNLGFYVYPSGRMTQLMINCKRNELFLSYLTSL